MLAKQLQLQLWKFDLQNETNLPIHLKHLSKRQKLDFFIELQNMSKTIVGSINRVFIVLIHSNLNTIIVWVY